MTIFMGDKSLLQLHHDLSFQKTIKGKAFPLVVTPLKSDTPMEFDSLVKFLKQNRSQFHELLSSHGAILFRGFECLEGASEFNDFIEMGLGDSALPYVGGAAPRKVISKNVFTSNESPPSEKIPFHHEMAQVPKYPSRIYFYSEIPAKSGGQTPILRSDFLYETLKDALPEFISKLEKEGVVYRRILPTEDDPDSPIGRGWKSTFLTQDFDKAKEKAKELGVDLIKHVSEYIDEKTGEKVKENTAISVSGVLSAVKQYQHTNVFFNSIVAAYTGWKDCRNKPEEAVMYGDGSKIDPKDIEKAKSIMDEVAVDWLWEKADLLCVDNSLSMHSRKTFEPPRRLFAYVAQ